MITFKPEPLSQGFSTSLKLYTLFPDTTKRLLVHSTTLLSFKIANKTMYIVIDFKHLQTSHILWLTLAEIGLVTKNIKKPVYTKKLRACFFILLTVPSRPTHFH